MREAEGKCPGGTQARNCEAGAWRGGGGQGVTGFLQWEDVNLLAPKLAGVTPGHCLTIPRDFCLERTCLSLGVCLWADYLSLNLSSHLCKMRVRTRTS